MSISAVASNHKRINLESRTRDASSFSLSVSTPIAQNCDNVLSSSNSQPVTFYELPMWDRLPSLTPLRHSVNSLCSSPPLHETKLLIGTWFVRWPVSRALNPPSIKYSNGKP